LTYRLVYFTFLLVNSSTGIEMLRLDNQLRVARAERRLSQEELARLAGVKRQTISSIETGQYVPSALLAFILADRLGKRVDELFNLAGDENDRPVDSARRAHGQR
jgi:putative transcriptional regulator